MSVGAVALPGEGGDPSDTPAGACRPRRVTAALAAILFVVAAAATLVDVPLDTPPFVTAAGMVVSLGLIVIGLWRTRGNDLLAPRTFFAVVLVGYYGLGSLNLIPWGTVPGGMWWLVLAAAAAFILGTDLVPAPVTYPPTATLARREPIRLGLAVALIAGVFVVSALALTIGFARTGIPLLGNVEVARLQLAGSGYLNTLGLAVRAAMVAATVLFLSLPAGASRPVRATLIAVVLLSGITLGVTGNRGHLVLMAVILFAAWHYLRRRATLKVAVALAVAGLAVYSLAGYLRSAQCDAEWGPRIEAYYGIPAPLAPLAPGYLSIRSVPAFVATIIGSVPESHPYTLGQLSIAPFMEILPGHQKGIDEFLKVDILGMSFVGHGIAAGGLTPPYVDFGYVGVVVAYFLVGVGVQALYVRARRGARAWVVVYVFTVGGLFLSLYGSLISNFSIVWLPILLFALFTVATRTAPALSATEACDPVGDGHALGRRWSMRDLGRGSTITLAFASYLGLAALVFVSFLTAPLVPARASGAQVPGTDVTDPGGTEEVGAAADCGS